MKWSLDEVDILKNLYPTTSNADIARHLGRSLHSVEMKAKSLNLKKKPSPAPEKIFEPDFSLFTLISREEAVRRDKIDLLRYCWSLTDLYNKELNNPNLEDAQRHKIMNSMANMINVTSTILRYTPEEVFQEKPDLNERLVKIIRADSPIQPRKYRQYDRRFVICRP
ncbi:hypothetical protein GF319_15840 [Candidatus Bathyarchaeota archaeon]|nr:hypothetical protein [Candidatus Bathyarchaeota archaeon]